MQANKKSKSYSGGVKSGNELVGPQNRPMLERGGGKSAGGSSKSTPNELVHPSNRPGGLGYGKK